MSEHPISPIVETLKCKAADAELMARLAHDDATRQAYWRLACELKRLIDRSGGHRR